MAKVVLIYAAFCCLVANVSAQDSLFAARWQEVEKSIVLLRNDGSLLPLTFDENEFVHQNSLGLTEGSVFHQMLEKCGGDRLNRRKIYFKKDYSVFALDADEFSPVNPDYLEFERKMNEDSSRLVFVLFGNLQIIDQMPPVLQRASAIILAPGVDEISQSLAAQMIFGSAAISGKLSENVGDLFQKSDGFTLPGNIRLGYAPPETVGLNARLLADSIAAIVQEGIRAHAFPGAQVLVAKDGKVVFHQVWGYHTYDSLQAVTTTDLYDFASITKVTSTLPALMKFYGEGKFDLDAPLKKYLRSFKKSNKGDLTFRSLLAHNGRLKPSIVFWRTPLKSSQGGEMKWKKRSFLSHFFERYPIRITDSLFLFKKYKKQIFKEIAAQPLNEKSGYVYSDLSFILYPEVVKKISGIKSLESYLNETFYQPLGAWTLGYNPLTRFPKERIVPTERDTFFRKIQVHGTVHDETAAMLGGVSGHAGLFGSAEDLAKLFQMYLNGGEYGGRRFITESALREFTRCQFCEEGNRRGLGFDKPLIEYDSLKSYVARSASPESFGHSGYTGTFVWADPTYHLLVIFFSNRVYPYRSSEGIYDLNIRPRVHQAVYDAMGK